MPRQAVRHELMNDNQDLSSFRDSSDSLRKIISADMVMKPKSVPNILVLDDDPTFGQIMRQVGAKKNVSISYCRSVDELSNLDSWDYDVIIMDYDLGSFSGFELTEYLEKFTSVEVPVILVSQSKLKCTQHWPQSIREFVHKGLGPFAILDAAFEAHEVSRIHQNMLVRRRSSKF